MNNKKRILIVDDEERFTRILRLNLGCTGRYTVRTENSALNACTTAREFRPDLILLDVMMPGLDGGEVAAQLRRLPSTKDTPVVFLTAAVTNDEIASRQGRIGGAPYVAKPVELDVLMDCIEQNLTRQPWAATPSWRPPPARSLTGLYARG
jgi:CheY-like chemotaxis protein